MSTSDLISLLQSKEELLNDNKDKEVIYSESKNIIQKSDKNASFYDFISMINKLIKLSIKECKFIADEKKIDELDAMKDFSCPVITYFLISREPKGELKPRFREELHLKERNDAEYTSIYGQRFQCLVQFDVAAKDSYTVEKIMTSFENMITMFTGFLKKNGVAEIFFKKQITDEKYTKLRETLSIRSLIYCVEIEKLTVISKEKINEIELLIQKEEN